MNKDKWEFYQDSSSEWRWRRIASNGKIVGASSQGYKNEQIVLQMLEEMDMWVELELRRLDVNSFSLY